MSYIPLGKSTDTIKYKKYFLFFFNCHVTYLLDIITFLQIVYNILYKVFDFHIHNDFIKYKKKNKNKYIIKRDFLMMPLWHYKKKYTPDTVLKKTPCLSYQPIHYLKNHIHSFKKRGLLCFTLYNVIIKLFMLSH